MMKRVGPIYVLLIPILFILLSACSNTKYLKEGEILYTGSKVDVVDSNMKRKERKELESELNAMTVPRPNSKFLGLRPKLFIWNIAGTPKKEKSIRSKFKNLGEPPVLLSAVNLSYNEDLLKSRLVNTGYFHAIVSGDTLVKNKRAEAEYTATAGPRYSIAQVTYPEDSSVISKTIYESAENTLLKPGDPYDLNIIRTERLRIDAYLKERGFYYFDENYIIVQVDSSVGNHMVNMYIRVKPETPDNARRVYTMNDIFVYSNYSLATAQEDTSKSNAVFYEGYYVADIENKYKPKLFQQAILFNPGDVYSRTQHNRTLNRLITLDLFKFVKNRFEPVQVEDSFKLDDFYYLTPYPKKSIRAEISGNTKTNNFTGSQITFGFKNRNTFRGGELLSVNAHLGFEVQVSGNTKGNSYRTGADATLSIPRFWIPILNLNTRGGYLPRTNIKIGFEILNRAKLYTINSFNTSFGFAWKESEIIQHEFNPISVNYVQPAKVTDEYKRRVLSEPSLQNVVDTQFIIGSTYNYLFNELSQGNPFKSGFYFDGMLDLSGNVAGVFHKGDILNGKASRIAGAVFSQYIKSQADFRYYLNLGKTSVLANRLIAGFGYPYGNSIALPFIKQFFVGGNNSVRAFRSRSIGPGTYLPPQTGTSDFLADQSGDIKLEMNTEYRTKLGGIFHGALFVDAGNTWLYRNNPYLPKPGAVFGKDFLKELAVGAGVGLRLDITILVLRLDVAFPLRKPYLPEADRWVMDQIDFGNKEWRKENIIFNLAIGYPF